LIDVTKCEGSCDYEALPIQVCAVGYPKDSGSIALRPMMYVALSYDHRIVDGAEAVGFLVHIKNAIENPERMLLGL
jgi:pyruvate/2-oxoglutarate dehydrogenase complex dihydrolipoamide acyltransferase (E2) component